MTHQPLTPAEKAAIACAFNYALARVCYSIDGRGLKNANRVRQAQIQWLQAARELGVAGLTLLAVKVGEMALAASRELHAERCGPRLAAYTSSGEGRAV